MSNKKDKIEKSRFLPKKYKEGYRERLKEIKHNQEEIAKKIKKNNSKIDLSLYSSIFLWNK